MYKDFDIAAARRKIKRDLEVDPCDTCDSATLEGQNSAQSRRVAEVAAPKVQSTHFLDTDNIEFEERAGIIAANGTPEEWVSGFATLVSLPYPENWTQDKWDRVLINTERFLDQWGAQAHSLGWSTNDVFGISQSGSLARLDCLGLVLFLDENRVTAMTDKSAALQRLNHRTGEPNGIIITFYRKQNMNLSVPLWEVQANG